MHKYYLLISYFPSFFGAVSQCPNKEWYTRYYHVFYYSLALSYSLLAACGESRVQVPVSHELADQDIDLRVEIIVQTANKRAYVPGRLDRVNLPKPILAGMVGQLRVLNDHIFVYDIASMNVKRYSLDGDLEVVYGIGRGQGPGEFENIVSFWVDGRESVWIVDSMSRNVSQFTYDGSFVGSFKPDFMPARVAVMNGRNLALLMYSQPELFALVDTSGAVIRRFAAFEELFKDPPRAPIPIYDGHLFPRPNGGIVWAPRFASYLYFFDDDTELVRRLSLIDGYSFPKLELKDNTSRVSARELEHSHRTLFVSYDEDMIFVDTRIKREGGQVRNVLDVYDDKTGMYVNSIALPEGGERYQSYRGILYAVDADTSIVAYQYKISA